MSKNINKDSWVKEIKELENILNISIGEYTFCDEDTRYTNREIAYLILSECERIKDMDVTRRNNVVSIMGMFMKYASAFVHDEDETLEQIEKNVIGSAYEGYHYFFKEAIFDTKISKTQKEQVLKTLNKKDFLIAGKLLRDLMEETNQLFIQEVWYDKVLTSINKYKNEKHCKKSK